MLPPSSGSRVNQAKNQREKCKRRADFLLGLFFDPENGGGILLRSVG
jgi:hypothetical protein